MGVRATLNREATAIPSREEAVQSLGRGVPNRSKNQDLERRRDCHGFGVLRAERRVRLEMQVEDNHARSCGH